MKIRRILRIALIIFLSLVLILVGIIYWQKDKILKMAVGEAEKLTQSKITYENSGISLIKNFPNLNVYFDALEVRPIMEDSSLVSMERANFSVQLFSLFKSNYHINEIYFVSPSIDLVCDSSEICNYSRWFESMQNGAPQTDTTADSTPPLELSIDHFGWSNGTVNYRSDFNGMALKLSNWNFDLSGDLNNEQFSAQLNNPSLNVELSEYGWKMIDSLPIRGKGDVTYDMENGNLEISQHHWFFNQLELLLKGSMAPLQDDQWNIDLEYLLPDNELKPLVSLMPGLYSSDYSEIQANGEFDLKGKVQGRLASSEDTYPAFEMQLAIKNGSIQDPALPDRLHDIQLTLEANKSEGPLNNTQIALSQFRARAGNKSKVEGRFNFTSLMQDPAIKGNLQSTIDGKEIRNSIALEMVEALSGTLEAAVELDLTQSDFQKMDFTSDQLSVDADLSDLIAKVTDYPEIRIQTGQIQLEGNRLSSNFQGLKGGESKIEQAEFTSDQFLANYLDKGLLRGAVALKGGPIFSDEWLEEAPTDNSSPPAEETPYDLSFIDLAFQADISDFRYSSYTLKDITANGTFGNDEVDIQSSAFEYEGGAFSLNGTIKNISPYLNGESDLLVDFDARGDQFDLWAYMSPEDESEQVPGSESAPPFELVDDVDLQLDYSLGQLSYHRTKFRQISGSLRMKDAEIIVSPTRGKTMGGELNMEGRFAAKKGTEPSYDFDIAARSLQFQEMFNSIVAVQKIAPLIEKMQGNSNLQLSLAGDLKNDLGLDYESLDVQGFIQTIRASLGGFRPFDKISEQTGIRLQDQLKFDDTKNWFAIEKGNFIVEPFQARIANEPWQIEGSHELFGEMDYTFTGPVSLKQLEGSPLGATILSNVRGVLTDIGFETFAQKEKIEVQIHLTGTRDRPSVSLRPAISLEDQIKSRSQSILQGKKEEAKEELEKQKEELLKKGKEAAKDEAKKLLKGDSTQHQQRLDSLKKEAEKKVKEAKKKFKKWNPFGSEK